MEKDKKCDKCSRMYRGEGFKGLCTEHCFEKKLVEPKERVFKKFEMYQDRPALTKRQMAIKASNEKWLNRAEPLNSRPGYLREYKIERSRLYGDQNGYGGWMNKFNPARG